MSPRTYATTKGSSGGAASDRLSVLTGAPIAVTGAVTATIGRMHYVTGTSANYTITLPAASGNTSKHIAFVFGPTITELSKFVTIDGNASEKINGLLSRLFWAGESLELECDGSNWWVVDYKPLPMICTMHKAGTQSVAVSTETKVLIDTTDVDNTGAMANTGGNEIIIRRTGQYSFETTVAISPLAELRVLIQNYPKLTGVALPNTATSAPSGDYVGINNIVMSWPATVGDDVESWMGFYGGTLNETVAAGAYLSVSEIVKW